MKTEHCNQWPTIDFVNRFFQAGIIALLLATLLSLGELLTGSM